MKEWQLFPFLSAPMPFQMALDEILFRKAIEGGLSNPVFRIYFTAEPWLTVGYSDPGPFPQGRKVCKRLTGGGRVEHGKDLIFSLIARKEADDSFSSVRVSYWKIHEAVKKAFELMGESPRFYRCDEKLARGGECFAFPIASDLALNNKKVAGGAQKRSQGVLLHQESIQLPKKINAFDFAARLQSALKTIFEIQLTDALLEPELLSSAKQFAALNYPELSGQSKSDSRQPEVCLTV